MVVDTLIFDEPLTDDLLNQRTIGWGTSFPSSWYAGSFFIRTDESKLYQNTGTENSPTWNSVIGGADTALIFVLG
jgi:hypothetical protein